MSPVSRGRAKKNRSAKGPRGRRSPVRALPADSARATLADIARALPGGLDLMAQARAWWPSSHAEILDAATCLLEVTSAIELEDGVCMLIGDHWRGLHEQHSTGFSPSGWLEGLITTAGPRAAEPAVHNLLRGIAMIAAPGLAGQALRALKDTRSLAAAGSAPAGPDSPPTLTVAPDVLLLREVYGLRFGLLAQVSAGGGPARTYLFDIDLCHGFDRVVGCGYHVDVTAATTAWRRGVGVSAAHSEPEPLPDGLLPQLLTGSVFDGLFSSAPGGDGFGELFRADRVAHEIVNALDRARRPVLWPKDAAQAARDLADTLTDQFRDWAAAHDVDLPPAEPVDDDILRWLLADWVSPGLTEHLALACSPHRIAAFTAYLNDDWQPEHRDHALTVLVPWVRYCLERSDITSPAADHALTWAEHATRDPQAVGGDHGRTLDRSVDETTTTESHH